MKYGPISAATSATMKAIASPSSVVCTVSPFEHAPAHLPARRGASPLWPCANAVRLRSVLRRRAEISAGARTYIETTVAKSQQPRVTLHAGRARSSPASGQPFEAAQHKGRPPFRIDGVVEPQVRQAAQQGRDLDLG